ncbi:hypothetical protein WAJ69_19210, partial [Acinetobacter baumannii]
NADSELMAKEILERKTSPELLPKALDRLIAMGDAQRAQQNAPQQSGGYGHYSQPQGNQSSDLDDDLPF